MVDSKGEIEDEYEGLGAIMRIKGGSKSVRWSDPMSCELRGSFQAWKDGVWPCLAAAREWKWDGNGKGFGVPLKQTWISRKSLELLLVF